VCGFGCLRHSLVRAYGIYVLTLNSNFYSKRSGVSVFDLALLVSGQTHHMHHRGGSRKRRTMGVRYAISAERSKLR
jgi:hypothetical protein